MKKLIAGLLLFSAPAWATYIPVNGSSVTVYAPNNNTTALPVSGTVSVNALPTGTNNVGTVSGSTVTIAAQTGATIPVSGTLSVNTHAVTQSGTWTVQPGNTANTTAWKVDGSAVTQPISGTVTALPGAQNLVVTSTATIPVSASQTGTWNVGTVTTLTSVTNPVTVVPGAQNLVVTSTATLPVSLAANQSVNVAQINAVTPLMGAGNTGTGSPRMTLATDNAAIAAWGLGATGAAVPSGAQYQAGIAKTSLPTAATDGNLTGSLRDKFGRTVTIADCPRDLIGTSTATITSSTSETVIISSGAAGVFNDLVSVIALNTSATATRVDFRSANFGAAISFALYIPAGETRGLTTSHVWPQSQAASQWTATSSASIADLRLYTTYCANK